MLLNISNVPYSKWTEKQKKAAANLFGVVQDIPFPYVNPYSKTLEVHHQALEILKKIEEIVIEEILEDKANSDFFKLDVMVQGEYVLTFQLVKMLIKKGVNCWVPTTEQNTVENPDGSSTVLLDFIQFRQY